MCRMKKVFCFILDGFVKLKILFSYIHSVRMINFHNLFCFFIFGFKTISIQIEYPKIQNVFLIATDSIYICVAAGKRLYRDHGWLQP